MFQGFVGLGVLKVALLFLCQLLCPADVPAVTPAVLLLAPNRLKATLQPGRARGNLWMLPPLTARPFCPPPPSQDNLTGTPTSCWRCGPQAPATPWPLLQLLARYHPMSMAHATPEQHRWLHTHLERAAERDTATVVWGPSAEAEWRFHRGTWGTKHPPITFLVLAKHRSATPGAPAYPVKHRCSQVQDWQTVEWTTFHPQKAYLLQYVYGYLTQGHEGNNDCVHMNPAATEIIRQGVGVYATWKLGPDANTQWPTTERGARIHAYQPTMPCRLPHPDDHTTVIFADASGTKSLTPAPGGAALELKAAEKQADCTNITSQGLPFSEPSLTGNWRHWRSSWTPSMTPTRNRVITRTMCG